jgi:hypothetical protein
MHLRMHPALIDHAIARFGQMGQRLWGTCLRTILRHRRAVAVC